MKKVIFFYNYVEMIKSFQSYKIVAIFDCFLSKLFRNLLRNLFDNFKFNLQFRNIPGSSSQHVVGVVPF